MRQFLILIVVLLSTAGCLTPKQKELRETVFTPLGVDLFAEVLPYVTAGLNIAVLEGSLTQTEADMLVVQIAAIQKGLEAGDLDKIKEANWPALEKWAIHAIEKQVIDGVVSPFGAALLFRQIANFNAYLNDMRSDIGYFLRRNSQPIHTTEFLVGGKPMYIGRLAKTNIAQGNRVNSR